MSAPEANTRIQISGIQEASGFPLVGVIYISLALFIAICLAAVLFFKLLDNEGLAMLFGMLAFVGMALGAPLCTVVAIVIAIFRPNARI